MHRCNCSILDVATVPKSLRDVPEYFLSVNDFSKK